MWIAKSKKEVMNDLKNYRPQLLVFDWNGNLHRNYTLDVPVITFAVKNDDSQLYAVSFNEEDINTLYVYNLEKAAEAGNYIHLSNDLFSMDVMKGYHFRERDPKDAYTFNDNEYHVSIIPLIQGLNRTYTELGTITIRLYTPLESTNNQTQIEDIIANIQKTAEDFQIQNLDKGNDTVYHCSYNRILKEYDGTESRLFFNSYLFSRANKIIHMEIISTQLDLKQYLPHFENMAQSFKLNN
jgi:hypothetical protein